MANPSGGLSLLEFCTAKALDVDFVRRLGITESAQFGGSVRIPYYDESGREVATRYRLALDGEDRFKWKSGTKQRPYGLDRLQAARDAGCILLVEGETDSITAWAHGVPAIGMPGANSWQPAWTPALDGIAKVIVAVEPDAGGDAVLRWLSKRPLGDRAHVMFFTKGDAKDLNELYLADRVGFGVKLLAAIDQAEPFDAVAHQPRVQDAIRRAASPVAPAPPAGKRSVATQLVDLALAGGVNLLHTADGEAFAVLPAAGHVETWPVRSSGLRLWLRQGFFEQTGASANAQALDDALGTLEGLALFHGAECAVHLRLAEAAGAIYLDLADPAWQVVEIRAGSWSVRADAPVRFRRPRGLQALPVPVGGGALDALRALLTVDDDTWRLIAGWLVGTVRPDRSFPVLAVHGEQGTAKTTLAKMLRRLIDPNLADLRPCPRNEYDVILAARNGWIVGFDNVSRIKPWLSDVLCRVATGIGFGRRELYSDGDEYLLSVKRPIVLNGIEEVAVKGDLLDRSIIVTLRRIEEDRRREEDEVWQAFATMHPRLLGALLDVAAGALSALPSVQLTRRPRMADFARWVTAAEPALGWAPGAFLRSYRRNRGRAVTTALEGSLIVDPLRKLLQATGDRFEGSVTELLRQLRERAGDQIPRDPEWPKDAIRLSGELRRLAPALRRDGIHLRFPQRTRDGRRVVAWSHEKRTGKSSSRTSPRSPHQTHRPGNGGQRDDGDVADAPSPPPASPLDRTNGPGTDGRRDDGDDDFPIFSSVGRSSPRCPRCGGTGWSTTLDPQWGHCRDCGAVRVLAGHHEREPGEEG
jgi:hypothetical protein